MSNNNYLIIIQLIALYICCSSCRYYTHCHHCLARSYNLIPCPHCPLSLYCSDKCRTLAWSAGHEVECSVQSVFSKLLNLDKDKIRILTKIIRLLLVATEYGTAIGKLRKDTQIAEKNSGIFISILFTYRMRCIQ